MRSICLMLVLFACQETESVLRDGASDAGTALDGSRKDVEAADASLADASARDASARDAAALDAADRDAAPDAFDAGPEPTTRIDPVVGELTIVQLDLPAGITARLGEAAVIVGPAGSLALLDVGNSNHDDNMRDMIRDLNTRVLTPANGYAARAALQVEWVILTHWHGDHVGGFEDLVTGSDAIEIVHGVVHRGFTDLGDAMNTNDYDEVCGLLRGSLAPKDLPLCAAAVPAPCPYDASTASVSECAALFHGDLATSSDDQDGVPSYIDLDGATITFVLASGHVSDGSTAQSVSTFGHTDSNEENARSLGGIIALGSFHYWFGGDLTGSGDTGEPDVEATVANIVVPNFLGPLGTDVAHAHHHARRTSSNATFIDAMAPLDGCSRNVVAGINAAHLGSPHGEVVEAWTDNQRLNQGRFWVTTSAAGGATSASHPDLIVADGEVIVQTVGAGIGYRVQAAGASVYSRTFLSVD